MPAKRIQKKLFSAEAVKRHLEGLSVQTFWDPSPCSPPSELRVVVADKKEVINPQPSIFVGKDIELVLENIKYDELLDM